MADAESEASFQSTCDKLHDIPSSSWSGVGRKGVEVPLA